VPVFAGRVAGVPQASCRNHHARLPRRSSGEGLSADVAGAALGRQVATFVMDRHFAATEDD
jgi:hypothetical protein